ncbi:MAG: hypothetical protein A2315_02410 [Ignavibacteria bacterium RIFOXYB2_FULL_35_12]|nr:MAG: hypothetical protein A2058_14465 [Ignavibacteria bacterium GWA2_36_19]OGU53535.1 MAG: hypothetical protein A2006_14930 [Ignavibacteria bacterium GWC2_35_8]OGU59088.1 MAG: hypothetical protein A2X60_05330 [Ignavibacteria bacterium GWF2_35_20]OGU79339.1 MAG: hypothetical protein A2254_09365 [Ignavibacteria bacterium RIFOXYA2_FULL_35_9]OGU88646.1 MAG: hypothetical protein A3K31_06590 [Ignavibacteria bacterium RIFOXYA12_FULL_35_25]OGU89918.1 MAG: hypothetical protein A2492_14240 [Ignavibac
MRIKRVCKNFIAASKSYFIVTSIFEKFGTLSMVSDNNIFFVPLISQMVKCQKGKISSLSKNIFNTQKKFGNQIVLDCFYQFQLSIPH